tara:strand:- start:354 stop:698 length:345 start_codon:yes stop_codon:yes gene_type:complete
MSEPKAVSVLLAPLGQLSGDGQLRESFHERRERRGKDYPMWYLTPDLVHKFDLSTQENLEAVVAEDPLAIAWLKLRFGGKRSETVIDVPLLKQIAGDPPPAPERRDIAIKRSSK